jgi:Tol biopolymer transport system component
MKNPFGSAESREHSDISFEVSPDGSQIVFPAAGVGGRDLYLMDLGSKRVRLVAQTKYYEQTPAFSPDGRWIIYAAGNSPQAPSHIFTCSRDGTQIKQITTGQSTYDRAPSFSRDGSQIVFARAHQHRTYSMGGFTWDDWDVYVMKADGTQLRRITQGDYYQIFPPRFSADDRAIVFAATPVAFGRVATDVYFADSRSAQPARQLTSDGHSYSATSFPDGKLILFISDRGSPFDYDIYRMDTDGSNTLQITQNKSYNTNPVPKGNGKEILFLSSPNRDNRYELWQVAIDGGNLRKIAGPDLFDAPLRWRPNPMK